MIKALFLRDFRNYKQAVITFSPKVNVILGDNAQGKTNLLEAIYLLITGRSFRTSHLSELIRFGAHAFYLEALFEKNGIEQTLKFSFDGEGRTIIHNFTLLPSLSSLIGILHGVVLSPEDRNLVKGGPQARRQFLDLLIAQSNPLYLHHLSRYIKAMKQRNALLKTKSLKTIAIWEEQMAPSAAFLTHRRSQTVKELESLSQSETMASDQLALAYRSSAPLSSAYEQLTHYFLTQFEKQRPRECELGSTLSGPHRDDLTIMLHDKEACKFASEGQQRSCITSLKLAHWKWLQQLLEEQPILCIDDVGVSFDRTREEELFKRINSLGQVFITSARPTGVEGHLIHIESGSVVA